jgi:hypothetical protein
MKLSKTSFEIFIPLDSKLFHALLSPLRPERDDVQRKDLKPVAHLERLCSFLVDSSRHGKDVSDFTFYNHASLTLS